MSEPRLISPLLDNFLMGDPISAHDGVYCCPAMRCQTDDKYIVKILSIPASQTQLDALLLAGAYTSKDAALAYFRELADASVREAQVLQQLSQTEGFTAYESWQIVDKEDGNGYDVYLLGTYKKTLAKILQRENMTHLNAVNLGLDLCAALVNCRKSGYLYVDLKPENIYFTDDRRYRIGDLGFLALDSLKYVSLPDKYRSAYTPPEIEDAFAAVSTTADIYAVGLILMQVFNGGTLPEDLTVAPAYADQEMAEILLKACAENPEDRWQDPAQMGQALISYIQRNGANDTPIVPVEEPEPEPEAEPEVLASDEPAEAAAEEAVEEETTEEETPTEEPDLTEATEEEPEEAAEEPTPEEAAEEPEETEVSPEEQADEPSEADAEAVAIDADKEQETEVEVPTEPITATEPEEDTFENLSFLDDVDAQISEEELAAFGRENADISDEVSSMLSQADELLAHPIPEPPVAPEPIEIPMPEPIVPEADVEAPTEEAEPESQEEPEEETSTEEPVEMDAPKKRRRPWLGVLITLLILAALAAGAYVFHQYYYLQNIDSLEVAGAEDYLTVTVHSQIPDELLTIVCADIYGNQFPASVVNGKAQFQELPADRAFYITANIRGIHRLTGDYTAVYTTPAQTILSQLQTVTGAEDGSAIFSFTVEGPEPSDWTLTYAAEDEQPQQITVGGHTANLSGLTPGKTYTLTLSTDEDLYVTGQTEHTFVASKVIRAQDVTFTACADGEVQIAWNVPEGQTVSQWTVVCTGEDGYIASMVTDKAEATFTGLDTTGACTVEILAEGMTVSEKATLPAGSMTITGIHVEQTDFKTLTIHWDALGKISAEGWCVTYTIDGNQAYEIITDDSCTATISPVYPGSAYLFTIRPVEDVPLFGANTAEYLVPEAENFAGYGLSADVITLSMCLTPEKEDWTHKDVKAKDYKTTFQIGQKASFVARTRSSYNISEDLIETMYIIRDEDGQIIKSGSTEKKWIDMWWRGYCEMDMPVMPDSEGSYTVDIFFNGTFVGQQAFTVVA